MRRTRLYVAGAMAAALALAVSGIAVGAAGDVVQTMNTEVSPSTLPGDDLKPAKLEFTAGGYYEGADGGEDKSRIPPKTSDVKVFFANNVEFDTSEAKKCNADIGTMTTDEAVAACEKAKVSRSGSATAALPLGPGGARVDVEGIVTAFNGPTSTAANRSSRAAGDPTILLHVYIESLDTASLLEGVLKEARGKFGNKLLVEVPALAGGLGALRDFFVAIRHGAYVQATCPKDDKVMDFKGVFLYTDAEREVVTDTQRCKPKG